MKRSLTASIAALGLVASAAYASSMFIDPTGNIGIGTETPGEKVHVLDGDFKVEQTAPQTNATLYFVTEGGTGTEKVWEIKQNGQTGRLTFYSPGGGAQTASFKFDRQAVENLFRVGVLGPDIVDINGKLLIKGQELIPDYVFEKDYTLKSIDEQAQFMFENKHLPSVPKAGENYTGSIDIAHYQMGMLEELEKAHIYISQLNETVKQLKQELAELKQAQ